MTLHRLVQATLRRVAGVAASSPYAPPRCSVHAASTVGVWQFAGRRLLGQHSYMRHQHVRCFSNASNSDLALGVRFRQPALVKAVLGDGAAGDTVTARGWVRSCRSQKNVSFIELSDGSTVRGLQVVVEPAAVADSGAGAVSLEAARNLPVGTSIVVHGTLTASPNPKAQRVELLAESVEVTGDCPSSYPLQKKRHSVEFLRQICHLRPRTNLIGAVTRVRHALATAVRSSLNANDFLEVHTPIITSNDCEGAGDLFQVTTDASSASLEDGGARDDDVDDAAEPGAGFFGKPAYLTVSGQLHAEAFACSMSRVYTFGPTFRAENSNTTRHLAEFWMLEPEAAFATMTDMIDLAEATVVDCLRSVTQECPEEVAFFGQWVDKGVPDRIAAALSEPFVRVSYQEAAERVTADHGSQVEDDGLSTEQEKWLCEAFGGRPVVVYNYPKACKPFYMRQNEDGVTVAAFDLLVPKLGELVGGSAREERLPLLQSAMEDAGLAGGDMEWYSDLRRFGSVPHAGFGLGFERLVQFATGVDNIRDVIAVPRSPGNCRL